MTFAIADVLFDGKFGAGWVDWGWGPRKHGDGGALGISFDGYSGIIFHHDGALQPRFGAVAFRYRAPEEFGDFLTVSLKSGSVDETTLPKISVNRAETVATPDGWNEAVVPMNVLNPTGVPFDRVIIQANRLVPSGFVELDKVVLAKPDEKFVLSRSVKGAVQCDKGATQINPLVYGTADTLRSTFAGAHRAGGNATTRLNWDLNAWNTGSDYFFENVGGTGSVYDGLDDDHAHGWKTAVVVPMIGWVAKDTTSVGFPVSKFGEQKAHDPSRPEAGDGHRPGGSNLSPGPPTQTSVPAPPELVRKWIETIKKRDAARGTRSVDMYILDNEPGLWNVTHRDVHPDPVTYDELLDRTVKYASVIRAADHDAVIAGPAAWGYSELFFSAKDLDGLALHLDRRAHDDIPLLPWYLTQLAAYEKRTGTRLIDVVDVHIYPQANGVYGSDARTDPETAALRIRSTRALWDPTYTDESWIGEPVDLIPRLKDWIEKTYPSLGISIGEWSFGAEDHMSGALAMAEAFGRFGQLGITSAFYWHGPKEGTPGFNAFRAYRNFDGKGGAFLNLSVPAKGGENLSVFASRDEHTSHLVVVLLNTDPAIGADVELDVSACGSSTSRRVFSYGGGSAGFVEKPPISEQGTLHEQVPPYTITVLDVSLTPPPG